MKDVYSNIVLFLDLASRRAINSGEELTLLLYIEQDIYIIKKYRKCESTIRTPSDNRDTIACFQANY